MLKIAFARGVEKAVGDLRFSTSDDAIVKEALLEKLRGGLRRIFRRGAKAVAEAPALKPPLHPGSKAKPEQLAEFAKKNLEYSGKQLERHGYNPLAKAEEAAKFTERAGPEAEKWLETVGAGGETGMLRGGWFGPSGLVLPTAAGAGIGYLADGREGALTGAGIGLGARLGASGLLQRAREARGFARALGKTPSLKGLMGTEAGKSALVASGLAGAGLGAAGYGVGRYVRPPEEPWYSGLGVGLTPQQTQEVSQMAMPLLSERLGIDPSVIQSLGQQYGIVPEQAPTPSMQYSLPADAEYY
jgi:hypothetical protein